MLNSSNNMYKQKGIGLLSLIIILLLIIFFASIVVKLAPVYINNVMVQRSMQDMARTGGTGLTGPIDVRDNLMKRLAVNGVTHVKVEDISVIKDALWYEVNTNYETRVPYIMNVSFLVSFDETIEVPVR
jgi:hypothetical protein